MSKEHYIPKDLDDCFVELYKILNKEEFDKIKNDDTVRYHHGLGRKLRNMWGLWSGSCLSAWFKSKGISHPDDMSGIILKSFGRHLNSSPIKLDEQIEYYKEYWQKLRASEK